VFEVNVLGVFLCVRAVLPVMRAGRSRPDRQRRLERRLPRDHVKQ
jgi:NAD(P)-dependent dehydrogenase (short-subunit alcohol dehydrogenase family)